MLTPAQHAGNTDWASPTSPQTVTDGRSVVAVAQLKSHCLAQAIILQPRGPTVPSLAPRMLQIGKSHHPQNLLSLQRRGFPLLSKLSMEVIQATWKTSVASFWSYCWQGRQAWGQKDPSIVGFQEILYCECAVLICRAHVEYQHLCSFCHCKLCN